MDDQKTADFRRDDIDLLALLERSLSFFTRYKWLFIVAAIAGLALGFLRYWSLPPLYKSRLILQSSLLTNQNNIQIITNWNSLLRSGDHETLSPLLNCTPSLLKKVRNLKADEIQKIFTPQNPNGFVVDAEVSDLSVFDDLQKALIYGFDNNGSVKDRLATRRNRLTQMINVTATEIESLDSVKNKLSNILDGKKNSSPLIIDASAISRQLVEMKEKLLSYKDELAFTSAVQVVQEFNAGKKPVGNNLIVWLILGILPCVAIAYAIALFHSINQKLKLRAQSLKQ